MTACAMHAGQREADLQKFVEGPGEALLQAAAKRGIIKMMEP
jgi:hypothetical protein